VSWLWGGFQVQKGAAMMMKQSLAGAVALVALATTAGAADLQPVLKAPVAAAEQQATGYVEIDSGFASTKRSFDHFNGWALGGTGRGNYWITRDVSVQVDAQAEGTSYGGAGGSRSSNHNYLVGAHWSWRDPQQYLFGLFAAAGDSGNNTFNFAQRHGLVGAEAQWYWNQLTFYSQGGYDSSFGTLDPVRDVEGINAWFLRSTGRYFINPNLLIEGTLMYAKGNIDSSLSGLFHNFHIWTWDLKGEWRFATAPFSVFAKYQGSATKYDAVFDNGVFVDEKLRDHRVLLGLKLHLGDRTLQQTDRSGATLDIISPLANPTGPLVFKP
jgi:opacity protein-like surface antigen